MFNVRMLNVLVCAGAKEKKAVNISLFYSNIPKFVKMVELMVIQNKKCTTSNFD